MAKGFRPGCKSSERRRFTELLLLASCVPSFLLLPPELFQLLSA